MTHYAVLRSRKMIMKQAIIDIDTPTAMSSPAVRKLET
jgi:hypothetical protein